MSTEEEKQWKERDIDRRYAKSEFVCDGKSLFSCGEGVNYKTVAYLEFRLTRAPDRLSVPPTSLGGSGDASP